MARRRLARQAAESVGDAANGNVTPPKKRKTAAKPAVSKPTQAKAKSRQVKAKPNKQENEVAISEPASPPKKSRTRQKNVADIATVAAVVKDDTKNKSKKRVDKEPEHTVVENNDAGEEVVEKRIRRGKTAAMVKKAGSKVTKTKPKARVSPAKKQTKTTVEDNAGDSKEKNTVDENPVKRTTRHMKVVEESNPLAQPITKVSRKRRNVEDTMGTIAKVQTTKEEEEKQEEEEENEANVPNKKLRGKQKKMETDDTPIMTSKGRSKKNSAKEIVKSPLKETEIKKQSSKKQNAAIQEDNKKTKNVKNAKKGKAKKAAPKRKLNAVTEETDDNQAEEAEEAVVPEVGVKENGDVHMVEPKQKKKNVAKSNTAMNGKVEAKGKLRKGQVTAASVDEKEATQALTAENEIIETNKISEIDTNHTKDVSSSKTGSVSENEEKSNNSEDLIKKEPITEILINEMERAESFVST